MTTLRTIAHALESWAPLAAAESYDNVGLQVGRMETEVKMALIALDLTHAVIDEALACGASVIITHHPNIFRPIKHVTDSGYVQSLVLRLAENRLAHYAIHTNLDNAKGGVSFALAALLGLQNVQFLEQKADSLQKLVVFVPETHAGVVRQALAEVGAGRIGEYDACAFSTQGTGYFRPSEAANPFIGAKGAVSSVSEQRLEVTIHRWALGAALNAVRQVHPYEEIAYDVIPLHQKSTQFGLGAIGSLPEPMPQPAFLNLVCEKLETPALRVVGDPAKPIQRVAVCGGAGSDFIGLAMRSRADAYLTADISYHYFFNVLDHTGHPMMTLADLGHYESEWITEVLLCDWLQARFSDVHFRRTAHKTNPTQVHIWQG